MEYNFNYEISLNVKFTNEEWELLDRSIKNSEYKHEAELGGFWYGKNNSRNWPEDTKEDNPVHFTFRQLDKLAKCLEPEMIFHMKSCELAKELFYKIGSSLRACNKEWEALSMIVDQDFRIA